MRRGVHGPPPSRMRLIEWRADHSGASEAGSERRATHVTSGAPDVLVLALTKLLPHLFRARRLRKLGAHRVDEFLLLLLELLLALLCEPRGQAVGMRRYNPRVRGDAGCEVTRDRACWAAGGTRGSRWRESAEGRRMRSGALSDFFSLT